MTYQRTTTSGLAVDLDLVREHMRITMDDLGSAMPHVFAAAAEVEAYADLALLRQTITVTTGEWPGRCIELPVGPVQPGAAATVALVEADGTTTAIVSGWWLEGGRHPRLHFTDAEPGGRLSITYQAGYGDTPSALPADLALAVVEQALALYDQRADLSAKPGLTPAAARILARYRRVRV